MHLDSPIKKICCVGGGYVGGPTSSVLALKLPDVRVTVVDRNEARIAAWNSNNLPFSEPGLLGVVKTARDGNLASDLYFANNSKQAEIGFHSRRQNLFFSTSVIETMQEADMIFVAVDTPPGPMELHGGAAPNLKTFYAVIQQIGETMRRDFILVNKSTVPCGTAMETKRFLSSILPLDVHCEVLSNPEFLAEGTAMNDLLNPDRIVIGSSTTRSGLAAATKLADLYAAWISRDRIVAVSSQSAELSKLAANTLLAQRISTINAMSTICDELGADIIEVSRICGLDQRIGPNMLRASLGFGGSCFRKDILHLTHTAADLGLHEVATYFDGILSINEYQTNRFADRIIESNPITTESKTIGILGCAFKPNTDDTRESPATRIMSTLVQRGYFIRVFDPLVPAVKIYQDLHTALPGSSVLIESCVKVCSNVYEACEGAQSVAILNGWDDLRSGPIVMNGNNSEKIDVVRRINSFERCSGGMIFSKFNLSGVIPSLRKQQASTRMVMERKFDGNVLRA
ncbi:MAG: hypothetical protein M1812_005832 [Candelaria pacifica]|nr:MAG: hypothetical protein M1812_005832 [Candelaria pacifica]